LGSVPRVLALAAALSLLLTLAPLGVASAQVPASFDGEVELSGVNPPDGDVPSRRFAGGDRIETSGIIATDDTNAGPFEPAAFDGSTVILARSDLEFDALAGSVLGGLEDAPIVLTPPNTDADGGELNPDTLATLEQFDQLEQIFLLGQEAAIAEDIESELTTEFPDVEVTRVGGVNRFETAALISERVSDPNTVIVARADDASDALVSGAIAADQEFPILLTGSDGDLDPFAAERLREIMPDRVFIAGGNMAISEGVEDDIESATAGAEIDRVFGNNAFSTAVRFAQLATEEFGFGTDHVNLARRDVAFDALALGPHAALDVNGPAPIVLTGPDELPDETEEYFTGDDTTPNEDLGEGIDDCLFESLDIAGGIAAVSNDVEDEARDLLSDAEGEPCNIELTPETATNLVGESHTVTAFVTDNAGNPSETGTVTFTTETATAETGTAGGTSETNTAQPTPESATVPVSETGTATFTFTSATPGRVIITASVRDSDGNVETATAIKDFVVPEGAFALNGGSDAPVAGQAVLGASLEGLFDEEDQEIEGVEDGTMLVAIDVRPNTGQLYGLGDDGELYKLDQDEEGTVTATSVGNVNDETGEEFNFDEGVGFDFNPVTVVALRITTSEGDSLRVNFDGMGNISAVIVDPDLFKTTGSGSETETAVATGAAYTNNPEPGSGETATSTMLFAIDTADDTLVQVNFMTGATTFVGDLSGDIDGDVTEVNGFDIVVSPSGDNVAYVLLTVDDEVGLYTVNLQTGAGFFVTDAESSDGLALDAFVNDQDMNTGGG